MKFDVICFGSATIDIYLTSPEFKIKNTQDGLMLCEEYGKKILLEDNIMTTGGGATNAAVCFERLGIQAGLVACVGQDYWASIVRAKLKEEGVSLIHLQSTNKKPTSSSIALVGKDGGRTVLVHRAASNLLSWHQVDWDRLDANFLYVTSLGGDLNLFTKIIKLAKVKNIKLAFNPGGLELKMAAKLRPYLKMVDILLVNKQELLQLLNKRKSKRYGLDDILKLQVDLVVVTEGRKGATVYSQDGQIYEQKVIKTKTVEETGAGDSFGSTFVAGQIMSLSIEQSLQMAAHNAASVVGAIGPKAGLMFWPEMKKEIKP